MTSSAWTEPLCLMSRASKAVFVMESKYALGSIIWILLWMLRVQHHPPTANQDIIFYILFGIWFHWGDVATGFRLLIILLIPIFLFTYRISSRDYWPKPAINKVKSLETKELLMRPMIFPCYITHTRLFPQKHSFTYPYLLVGIPVGCEGSFGPNLSTENSPSRSWLHVAASDYLDRSDSTPTLEAKLHSYLTAKEVEEGKYPHAYLVTAPQIFGYSFNPVSFWYLYSADQELKAMILEVNNTFDERRMYLLRGDDVRENEKVPSEISSDGSVRELEKTTLLKDGKAMGIKDCFSKYWKKDFHVSPFNSRNGSYTLLADDPKPFRKHGCDVLSNTITLLSSQNRPKLVAKISSAGTPIDLITLAGWSKIIFLLGWMWVGFLTFPRILKEASTLYLRRKLQVWYRPEVTQNSIPRNSTSTEKSLETFFYRYLHHAVEQTNLPLHLIYVPPSDLRPKTDMYSAKPASGVERPTQLEIRVLSPAFYYRFIHYNSSAEAFDWEFLYADPRSQTVLVSSPSLLATIFPRIPKLGCQATTTFVTSSLGVTDQARWAVLRLLRCPPMAQSYPGKVTDNRKANHQHMPCVRLSQLDEYVIKYCPDQWLYRRNAELCFLAQRFAGGLPLVLEVVDVTVRLLLILVGWRSFAINNTNEHSTTTLLEHVMGSLATAALVALHNSIHLWELLKGL